MLFAVSFYLVGASLPTSHVARRELGHNKGFPNKGFPDYPMMQKSYKKGFFGLYPQTQAPPPMMAPPMMPPAPPPAPPPQPEYYAPPSRSTNPPSRSVPEYRKDEYVITTDADFTCPSGFNLAGSKCVKQDVQESMLGCREGWRFDEGVCYGVDAKVPEYVCDPRFDLVDNECVEVLLAPQQMMCPPGYVIAGDACIKFVHTQADMACNSGKLVREKKKEGREGRKEGKREITIDLFISRINYFIN